jgi:D-xylose transport system substrate-binding protein
MKRYRNFLLSSAAFVIIALVITLSAFRSPEKIKIGFLVHDLVGERWEKDMANFSKKIETLGGEAIIKNADGNADTQVTQGKALVDAGIKVIAVVPQNATVLAELVTYADKAGAKIIAYDRMILNCDLHYYISFNSVKVGELMAEYATNLKPKGNYIILKGPSSDNNALLVQKGIMNKLKKDIDNGNIKIILEKEMDSWYGLSSLMAMDAFISTNKKPIDVILTGADDLATGAIDAARAAKLPKMIVTGQDATIDACKNIMLGNQTMTVYKSIEKLSSEAAIVAMKIAKGEKVEITTTLNNGKKEVPSILFDPIVVDKSNLRATVVADGHIKESDLR